MINHLKKKLKTTYKNTKPKINKSIHNNLKKTYKNFKLFKNTYFDHQILHHLITFIYKTPSTIIKYFQKNTIITINKFNHIKKTKKNLTIKSNSFINNIIKNNNKFIKQNFIKYNNFKTLIKNYPITYFSLFTTTIPIKLNHIIKFSYKPIQQFYKQYNIIHSKFQQYINQNYHIIILIKTKTKIKHIQTILNKIHIPSITKLHHSISSKQTIIIKNNLSKKFKLPNIKLIIITKHKLFKSKQKKQQKHTKTISNTKKIKSYQNLNIKNYIIHIHHNINKYLNIKTLKIKQTHHNYIKLQYKNTDQLFIPIDQIDQIQKYITSKNKTPKLNKLNNNK